MAETMLVVGSLGCARLQKHSANDKHMEDRGRAQMNRVLTSQETTRFRNKRLITRKQIQAELQWTSK